MTISLVIPAFNEEMEIGACLDSVLEHAKERLSEIIVVDNASTDRTVAIVRGYPKVRSVTEARKGSGYARQRGLQEASGEIIAFIDADVRLPACWLDTVKHVFDTYPEIVALSGPYRFYNGSIWRSRILTVSCHYLLLIGYYLFGAMVIGGNFAARREALEAIGGFDQTISFYGDDADVSRRIKRQGKMLYRSDFFVYTSSRRFDAEGLLAASARYVVNFLWVFLFHHPYSTSHRDIRADHHMDVP